jgi:hypothetical protein
MTGYQTLDWHMKASGPSRAFSGLNPETGDKPVSEILICNQHLTRLLAQEISGANLTFLLVIISGSRNEKALATRIFFIWSIYCSRETRL